MSDYVIAAGGSGAKCVEALVYLCAAGLGPENLTVMFVDADRSNGNLLRALEALERYRVLRETMKGESAFLRTQLDVTEPPVWSPLESLGPGATLESLFEYQVLRGQSPKDASLFDMLYSPEQRTADLSRGFRGQPSIGGGVFAASWISLTGDAWRRMRERVRSEMHAGRRSKVFLFASVFGGTGSAALASLPRLIGADNELKRSQVPMGAAVLLPYFPIGLPREAGIAERESVGERFGVTAKDVLRHFGSRATDDYNRMYVLGDQALGAQDPFAIGGVEQRNRPHLVELLAALAAIDFCEGAEVDERKLIMAAHREGEPFSWLDVPQGSRVQARLGQLARMTFTYLKMFLPRLEEIRESGGPARRTPWYVDFFERRNIDLLGPAATEDLKRLRTFSMEYLSWLRDISAGSGGVGAAGGGGLADRGAFPDPGNPPIGLVEDRFGTMLLEQHTRERSASDIWRAMCGSAGRHRNRNSALGSFFEALYDASI